MEVNDMSLHTYLSSPRMRGPSTSRLLGSIIAVSGILGHPPARVTTTEYDFAISRRITSEVCWRTPALQSEGAGKTGCLLHPRSRVRFAQTNGHTSIQGSWSIPAFPAQWLYGLLRALPGERLFCLRRRGRSFASPGLSASTAAPEPHDFAVRSSRTRQSQLSRPSHLTARS